VELRGHGVTAKRADYRRRQERNTGGGERNVPVGHRQTLAGIIAAPAHPRQIYFAPGVEIALARVAVVFVITVDEARRDAEVAAAFDEEQRQVPWRAAFAQKCFLGGMTRAVL